jgi:uracil phosphoribosyltransferase
LDGKTFMLVDPMLATGKSFEAAYKAYLTHGTPAKLHIVAVVASEQGVAYLQKLFPSDEVTLWCAVIDPELNSLSYIVPGLGDCGDLCYGEKL